MVVTPSFTHLSVTFSNQRFSNCNPTVDVGFVKLTSVSFCRNRVFKKNIVLLSCHLCCSSSVIFRNSPSQCTRSLSVKVEFHPLFLFADVFPWFVYADIFLETVALDTPNNVTDFVTDAPAKRAPTICPLSELGKTPIFWFFTRTVTQHNHTIPKALTRALQHLNNGRERSMSATELLSV
jgi:hypothetical protein